MAVSWKREGEQHSRECAPSAVNARTRYLTIQGLNCSSFCRRAATRVGFAPLLELADAHAEHRRRALRGRDDIGRITLAGEALHDRVGFLLLAKRGDLDREPVASWFGRRGRSCGGAGVAAQAPAAEPQRPERGAGAMLSAFGAGGFAGGAGDGVRLELLFRGLGRSETLGIAELFARGRR